MNPLRVAVVCDLLEENWPSMDLVASMLLQHLIADHEGAVAATRICPPMRRRLSKQKSEVGSQSEARSRESRVGSRESETRGRRFNADSFVNRFWDYPRHVRRRKSDFDLFHVIDHSYGQLVHELPRERTIVTCHDLDTFQCLLEPAQKRRSVLFKKMVSRTLSGFRRAARVTCVSNATRNQLLAYDLVPAERMVVIPNGVHPSCSPEPNQLADAEAAKLLGATHGRGREFHTGQSEDQLDMLHVGSSIPRKRIDILLRVFASVKELFPNARLLRVGGAFTAEQTALVEKLGLRESIVVLPHIERNVLAAVYRRAALVLQPSEREGFGLPVVEAMACGTPVVASDLPVLREVGGVAASYCSVADVPAWTESISNLLLERDQQPEKWVGRRVAGIAQAAKFSWAEYTQKMVALYQEIN